MTFEEFKNSKRGNAWIIEPGIEIYIRRSIRPGIDFELANLLAGDPGKGCLTEFLNKYEKEHSFFVECIYNPRLFNYLERRGYKDVSSVYDKHMEKRK